MKQSHYPIDATTDMLYDKEIHKIMTIVSSNMKL